MTEENEAMNQKKDDVVRDMVRDIENLHEKIHGENGNGVVAPTTPIHGMKSKRLKVIPDERGRLMEVLRFDDDMFIRFGQAYITTVHHGVTKAWHYHKIQYDAMCCVKGTLKLVLYDSRENSPTKGAVNEFFIGEHNPMLVQFPPGVYHGFKGVGKGEAIVLNLPTETYCYDKPDEYRLDAHDNDIPYAWARKDG